MSDQAANHIDQLEKRLASLHDLGVDTAGLRSQLAFARTQVSEGRVAEALNICEEVADTARRLADGSAPAPERVRTGRFTRDQLSAAVHDLMAQGMFAKLMAEHRGGPDIRLEARLNALDENLRGYVGHEADALRVEQQVLREELEQMRRSIGTAVATPVAESSARVEALRTVAERSPAATPVVEAVEPTWSQQLGTTLQLVAERLQSSPGAAPVATAAETTVETSEPAWSQALRDALDAVVTRLGAQPMTLVAEPTQAAEPAWAVALREALAGAEARHHDLLAAVATRDAQVAGEPALGEQLAHAFERGLHDLGKLLLIQRENLASPQSMDESRSALSRVTAAEDNSTTRTVAHTTTRTDRVAPLAFVDHEAIRQLVAHEIEAHLGRQHTAVIPGRREGTERIRSLVAAELEVRHGGVERTAGNDASDLRAALLRLLPDLLHDEAVRRSLFAVMALEAVSKPGVMAELTGLRAFLKRELSHAAEDLAAKLQPA